MAASGSRPNRAHASLAVSASRPHSSNLRACTMLHDYYVGKLDPGPAWPWKSQLIIRLLTSVDEELMRTVSPATD